MSVTEWNIALAQDCNMRCSYCNTDHGRLGARPKVMDPGTWEKLADLVLEQAGREKDISFSLQSGETFLLFDRFQAFVEFYQDLGRKKGIMFHLKVITNGTLLDEPRLQYLANAGVFLTFSIDGPAHLHDRMRRDKRGRGTHAAALASWKRYQELSQNMGNNAGCVVQSVISDLGGLKEVDEFWRGQGVKVYQAHLQEPHPWSQQDNQGKLDKRRQRFIADNHQLAVDMAAKTGAPQFLSQFRGPAHILKTWTDLLTGSHTARTCQAGRSLLAVDARGYIYPCEGFLGKPKRRIGDIWSGVDFEKRQGFLAQCDRIAAACDDCQVEGLCEGACFASGGKEGELALAMEGECAFKTSLITSAKQSYNLMDGKSHDS